jgi:HEPN domain-containing protein
MKQLSQDWLDAAQDDLLTIESILNNPILTNIVAFHSQQAIEKSFKAIIEEFAIPLKKIHNLQTLYLNIEKLLDFPVNELILSELDRLYIDTRYPTEFGLMPEGKPSPKESLVYYEEASRIKKKVELLLLTYQSK